ncbi:hypothetical protein ACNKHT_11450 [Shigella flexneri]
MQSEAGAIATVHGALQNGASPFNIVYVIAGFAADDPDAVQTGRRTDAIVLHVAARTVATHALSIFGDHSDVMAVRRDGLRDVVCG